MHLIPRLIETVTRYAGQLDRQQWVIVSFLVLGLGLVTMCGFGSPEQLLEDAMDFALPSLPVPVALAAVAVIGYLIGRFQRSETARASDATRRELKRAQAVVVDLERIAHRVRRELALHHANLATFKRRVGEMTRTSETSDWRSLCDEAERLLKPTQDLAMQLAHAYEGIRQQSSRLMSFSGQRATRSRAYAIGRR